MRPAAAFPTALAALLLASTAQAQPGPALQVDRQTAQRLGAGDVVLHVGRTGIDTVAAAASVDQLRRGEMLVTITGRGVEAVQPLPVAPAVRAPAGAAVPPPPRGEESAAPSAAPAEPPAPAEEERLTYGLGYEIGVGDRSGRRFHILTPIVEVENGGLRYDPRVGAYVGSILIGLMDRESPGEHGLLWEPVVVQISGEVQSVQPVSLARINVPFERVELRVDRVSGDSVRIRLRPTFDPAGVQLTVPVHPARLTVVSSPARIAGMGLEKSELLLQGPHGADSVRVTLASVRGNPSPNQLWLGAAGATARLRSAGIGWDTVTVLAGPYRGVVAVQYRWPVGFLLATLLGGLVGGVLNGLSASRRHDVRTAALLAVQGVPAGFAAAVLYAVGINVLGWAPDAQYGEALAFTLAFGGGLAGPRIFDRLAPGLSAATAAPAAREPAEEPGAAQVG
jgi:hypothetical protein